VGRTLRVQQVALQAQQRAFQPEAEQLQDAQPAQAKPALQPEAPVRRALPTRVASEPEARWSASAQPAV
jgi:hypothetical protein